MAEEEDSAESRKALRREVFHLIEDEDVRDDIPKKVLEVFIRDAWEGIKNKQSPKK